MLTFMEYKFFAVSFDDKTPFNVFDPNLNRTVYQNKSASLA